ncbi:pantoate--beta-alanine ligase [Nitrospira lenta]|uniref:Pantothenate synthetase n=1 Tax=Nitrospira lenta TaxID=1436998 RepID=A0A330L284_9BACT|nr:pantoate--beta-alanine ligase [Nitrospira lenta]SPP63850.1 Pantothenate synthetase [Nitrospira lenta]
MRIIRPPKTMAAWSQRLHREGVTIGFVPTMGALHDGHRALIRAARLQCDALVVSIFVNPTQFAPTEDLAKYPRPIAKDRALCRAEGVDVCFEPGVTAMYPEGFDTVVTVPGIARRWEGESRPHHFAGVATVVTKLFGMVRPDIAVFGQKDFQQAALVQRVIDDLSLGVKLIVYPTVREQDGLAMSSRNVYLSATERALAPILNKSLQAGAAAIKDGATAGRKIHAVMTQVLRREPAAAVDYLAVCDPDTLTPLESVRDRAILLGAIRIGHVRLIDNVVVRRPAKRERR